MWTRTSRGPRLGDGDLVADGVRVPVVLAEDGSAAGWVRHFGGLLVREMLLLLILLLPPPGGELLSISISAAAGIGAPGSAPPPLGSSGPDGSCACRLGWATGGILEVPHCGPQRLSFDVADVSGRSSDIKLEYLQNECN